MTRCALGTAQLPSPNHTSTPHSQFQPRAATALQLTPLGDRLLVQPREQEQQTAGGILLASSGKPSLAEAVVGTVLAVGPEVDIGVAAGDQVLFSKYGSSDLEAPKGEVRWREQAGVRS